MAYESGVKMRFRPAGSRKKRSGEAVYGPLTTGCPAVEKAVSALYHAQNEESFWSLMNALNYALELDTRVLVPLQSAPDPQGKPAPWAEHPVPAEKAKDFRSGSCAPTRAKVTYPSSSHWKRPRRSAVPPPAP